MKQLTIYITSIIILLLASCSSSDGIEDPNVKFPSDETWHEEIMDGSSVTIKPFTPGDAFTRSSLIFDSQNLIFGWNAGDKIGIYPTAKDKEKAGSTDGLLNPETVADRHVSYEQDHNIWRTDPTKASQYLFIANNPENGSQTVRITNNNESFNWDEIVRWSAYYPYSADDIDKNNKPASETYVSRTFDFTNQTQNGLVNISAYKKGTTGDNTIGATNAEYRASEASACAHLGTKDVMISSEMTWSGTRINFQMRHVGAVIRFYLFAPEEDLIIDNIKLICDSKIFYEKGEFTLKSHPYVDNATKDYGVNLDLTSDDCQIKPLGEATNMLELKFQENSAKTVYDVSNSYKRYIAAYLMTYPITYNPATHGNLFAYVTAHRASDSKEVHFVSNALEGKTMQSGRYYQWKSVTHVQDGLYPIELTATLLPWQDIVGSGINADLEK